MTMTGDGISEEGRQHRFAAWERLGLDRVKNDLLSGGYHLIGGPPQVRALAWEWVRKKEAEQLAASSVTQLGGLPMPPAMSAARRRHILAATSLLKGLGHTGFDRMLLELGVPEDVGTGSGLLARANSLARYILSNPDSKAVDGALIGDMVLARACSLFDRGIVLPNVNDQERSEYQDAFANDGDANSPPMSPAVSNAEYVRRKPRRKVFIVHGHETGPRESVARFLERLAFEPVILHERPNKGRTIITKFQEEAADVGFAVVLMTPDDIGGTQGLVAASMAPRARQNVIFELGFFIGVLGPERVAALVKGTVERPSDFDGVVYIDLDDQGAWKLTLARELQAAGFEVDLNNA
jgi:predicted nucleotide-binding protein